MTRQVDSSPLMASCCTAWTPSASRRAVPAASRIGCAHAHTQPQRRAAAAERVDRKQTAIEQDRGSVRHALDLGQDVRGDQHGAAFGQRADQPTQLDDLARVEPVGGLIEHQDLRTVQDRLRDGHALAVAARELGDQQLAHRTQDQAIARGIDRVAECGSVETAQPAHEGEKFGDTHLRVERNVLRHIAHAPARLQAVCDHVEAADAGAPRGGLQVARQDAQDRALARAVRAEQPDHLARPHVERDGIDREAGSVALRERLSDHNRGHSGMRRNQDHQKDAGAKSRPGVYGITGCRKLPTWISRRIPGASSWP